MRLIWLTALIAAVLLGGHAAHANYTNTYGPHPPNLACATTHDPITQIAYCGQYNVAGPPSGGTACAPGGSTWPSCADAVNCAFFVAPTGGSDSNPGTSSAPFATLERLQTALRSAVSLSKVGCLKAGSGGTYHRTATLSLTTADNGETWQFDPASGVNTATLDGGGTVDMINLGAANFKWNGIAITNVLGHAFFNGGQDNFTLENSDISGNHGSGACGDGFPPILCIGPGRNWRITNNYVHDTISMGISLFAFNAGDSIDGAVIANNVVLRACQQVADCGGIYINMRSSGTTGGTVTVKNNFVRDWGSSAVTGFGGMRCIYFDDNTSNSIATGNICGPPLAGAINSGNENNSGDVLVNGGTNNTFTGNIFDTGASGMVAIEGGSGNSGNPAPGMPSANTMTISNNIVLFNFTGPLLTSWSGVTGFAYYQGGPASSYTIKNNAYINYAGGSVFSNGQAANDNNPVTLSPANVGLSGYTYTIAGNSAALAPPISFPPIAGGWGPPGFVVPTSTNHSDP